ncbi:hypothetical protein D3C81_1267460 [compost metagenome]
MVEQQGNQATSPDVRRRRRPGDLAYYFTRQHGAQLHRLVIGRYRRTNEMILHALTKPYMPGNKVAGAGMTKHAAAVHAQIVQRVRHPMFAQIGGGGADDELQGKQAACDQPVLRREPDPKAHIDSLLYPVADTVIELHIRLDLGVEPAVLVQHWADDHLRDRAWPHDPQWAGECFSGLPRG